jgi:hypothetical protein
MVHIPLMFLSGWREFLLLSSLAGKIKLDDILLRYVEIARLT